MGNIFVVPCLAKDSRDRHSWLQASKLPAEPPSQRQGVNPLPLAGTFFVEW